MKFVLDTDVVVAAMRSPSGASAALIDLAIDDRISLLGNVALALEYESVLQRPQHIDQSGLTRAEVEIFVHGLIALLHPVSTRFIWRPQLRDAADEMVLEAAINGQADALVSFNHKHFRLGAARFGLRLLLPSTALQLARKEHHG